MFHVLHRVYVISWAVLGIGAVVWLYPRTGLSEPLMDWYAVWQNGTGETVKPVAELSGKVTRVDDGTSFVLRVGDREWYTVGLLGVTGPRLSPRPPSTEIEKAQQNKAFLSDLVLSNQVEVAATFLDPQHRAVGVVHLGSTNINAAVVEAGLVKFKPEFIKGLSWHDQYEFMRAARRASNKGEPTP
jgi:endonuclease YncB( thermonuclease family)